MKEQQKKRPKVSKEKEVELNGKRPACDDSLLSLLGRLADEKTQR